jgi:DNA-binding MarR family transcriptional regulator
MDKRACTGRNIMVIDKYFKLYFRRMLKEYDLNSAEGMVLLALFGSDGLTEKQILTTIHSGIGAQTQEQIIRELHYDKGVLTRTMQSLEEKKYVTRCKNLQDSRAYDFHLTDKAKEFRPKLISILSQWHARLIEGLDQKTLDILDKALETMTKNAIGTCGSSEEQADARAE